jgi:hypothetical protein
MTRSTFIGFLDAYGDMIRFFSDTDEDVYLKYRTAAESYYSENMMAAAEAFVTEMKAPLMALLRLRHEVGATAYDNALHRPLPGTEITKLVNRNSKLIKRTWSDRPAFKRGGS